MSEIANSETDTMTVTETNASEKIYSVSERRRLCGVLGEIKSKTTLKRICKIVMENNVRYECDDNGFSLDLMDLSNAVLGKIDVIITKYMKKIEENNWALTLEKRLLNKK